MSFVIATMMTLAPGALSGVNLQEERLRFVFANRQNTDRFMISGDRTEPTQWSRHSLVDVVAGCSGKRIGVQYDSPYRVIVDAESGADNLRIAKCVKAAVSVRFAVGVRTGRGKLDQTGFMGLWDRNLSAVSAAH